MKRVLFSLALAAALVLPFAISRTENASAQGACGSPWSTAGLAPTLAGCDPFDINVGNCDMTNVGASAGDGGNTHTYDYVLLAPCGDTHVVGSYSVTTKVVKEKLTENGITILATWTCPDDPWAYHQQSISCQRQAINATGNLDGINTAALADATYPLGAIPLSYKSRTVLAAQLQNAINQLQTPAPAPAPAPALQLSSTPACIVCNLDPSTFQIGSASASPAPAYHAPSIVSGWPQLSTSTQGEAVTSLQYLLQLSGAALTVDGKFGPSTDTAVRAFQKAQGLTVDGIVGPNTWQALIVTVQQGSQGAAVQAVQSQLKSRGVSIVVDGDFGAQTDAAVRTYQQTSNLTVDGQVGPQTWQALLAGK